MSLQMLDAVQQLLFSAEEVQMSFGLLEMWAKMGIFARLITAVLVVMSAYSLGVMAERIVTYVRAARASRRYAEKLRELLPAGKYEEAVALAKQLRRGHLARVLGSAVDEYRHVAGASTAGDAGDPIEAVTRALDRSTIRVVADLRRGLGGLATIGSSAPFVGLLGTVAGIITAFQSMARTGSGGLGSVSAGIAEALVTTAFGLLVAIPAVMMFNALTSRVDAMQVDIDESAMEMVDFLVKRGRRGEP